MSDYLREEILIEILVKLPVKSLIRATSVCKQWRSLIRSPYFISTHLSNSETQALVRRYDKNDKQEHYTVIPKRGYFVINSDSELEFPFKSEIDFFRIVGSCDCLVCLTDDYYNVFEPDPTPIMIWNPSIRNHVVLPQPLINPDGFHLVLLGFGVASNVYKVVKIVYCSIPDHDGFILPPQAEIFSLGTGEWRKLGEFDVRVRLLDYMGRPISFKGFLHWTACQPVSDSNSILRFHVGDEVLGVAMLPEELAERETVGPTLSLAIIGEFFGAVICDDDVDNPRSRCGVWVMKDYGVKESWTRLYTINLVGIRRVIGFWGSDEALLTDYRCNFVTYNAETKGFKHVGVSVKGWSFYLGDYKESLVLLGGYGGREEFGSRCISGVKTFGWTGNRNRSALSLNLHKTINRSIF